MDLVVEIDTLAVIYHTIASTSCDAAAQLKSLLKTNLLSKRVYLKQPVCHTPGLTLRGLHTAARAGRASARWADRKPVSRKEVQKCHQMFKEVWE